MTNPTEPTTSKLDQLELLALCRYAMATGLYGYERDERMAEFHRRFDPATCAAILSALQSAEASLARMTEQVAEMQADHAEAFKELQADAGGERLRAALEPFARFYNDLDKLQLITGGKMPHDSKCIATIAHAGVGPRIELGDFRRASLALSGGAEKQGLTASNASRAAMGPVAHVAPEAEPSAADGFVLGETWPDWFAVLHMHNIAITGNVDGRWGGGPDFCEIHRPDGSSLVKKFGHTITPRDFFAPVPSGASAETEGL